MVDRVNLINLKCEVLLIDRYVDFMNLKCEVLLRPVYERNSIYSIRGWLIIILADSNEALYDFGEFNEFER